MFDLEEGVQIQAKSILAEYPWLIKNVPGKSPADPFVIALALDRKLTVVTEEGPGGARKPQIPYVCNAMGVSCVNLLGLLDNEDWVL